MMEIADLTKEEQLFSRKQSTQLQLESGALLSASIEWENGHRNVEETPYHTVLNHEGIADKLHETLTVLGSADGQNILHSAADLLTYAQAHPDGIRIDHNGLTCITTFDPEKPAASMQVYDTNTFDYHLSQASRGVRIKSGGKEFTVPDGGRIVVDYQNGEKPEVKTVRFIDATHFQIGESSLGIFHHDEYAGILDRNGYSVSPYIEKDVMDVILVKPGQVPEKAQIENRLECLQKVVGGYIEAVYPWEDNVGLVCNEEGKINGMRPNRALHDDEGKIYDVICGPFLVVGLGEDNFASLTEEQTQRYMERFHFPERFYIRGDEIVCAKIDPDPPKKTRGMQM